MNLLFDLTQSVFNVFKQSADYFSRYVEQIVHYWEKRVGQFQDVNTQMCSSLYPRTLSHLGRLPCIVKAVCDQRDDLTGADLKCLLQDQWVEAKEAFESIISVVQSQTLHGESPSRRSKRKRRSVNEHFQLDEIELDRRTYNYLKNTTEHCIISKDEIELTNLMCHNVFVCKEEQCALPQPSPDVVYRVCAKNGSPKGHNCKIDDNEEITAAIRYKQKLFTNYNLRRP